MFIISQFQEFDNLATEGKSEHFIRLDDEFGNNVRDVPNNDPKDGVQSLKYDLFRTKTPLFRLIGEIWRNLDFNLD